MPTWPSLTSLGSGVVGCLSQPDVGRSLGCPPDLHWKGWDGDAPLACEVWLAQSTYYLKLSCFAGLPLVCPLEWGEQSFLGACFVCARWCPWVTSFSSTQSGHMRRSEHSACSCLVVQGPNCSDFFAPPFQLFFLFFIDNVPCFFSCA